MWGQTAMRKLSTIFIYGDDQGRLEIDDTGHLYWNGKTVLTSQQVTLSWWVSGAIIAAGGSALVTAAIAVIRVIQWWPPAA